MRAVRSLLFKNNVRTVHICWSYALAHEYIKHSVKVVKPIVFLVYLLLLAT